MSPYTPSQSESQNVHEDVHHYIGNSSDESSALSGVEIQLLQNL